MDYSKLEPSESFVDLQHRHRRKRSWATTYVIGLSIFAVTVIVLVYVTTRIRVEADEVDDVQRTSSAGSLGPTDCGNDIDTAIANDCQLDILSSNWTPRLCHNAEFYQEAVAGHATVDNSHLAGRFGLPTFEYFEDENKSLPLRSLAEVEDFLTARARAGLPLQLVSDKSWHAAHCSYLGRVSVLAMEKLARGHTEVWVPAVTTIMEHAKHCETVYGRPFTEEGKTDPPRTRIGFSFIPCVRLG